MATRGIKQLTKLRFVYCEIGGSSSTIREYISSGKIIEFANENPSVSVIVQLRNGKHPYIKGEYLTGSPKQICVKNESIQRIQTVVDKLNNSSGRKIKKLRKPILTETPSVQGIWTPMLDIAGLQFPIKIVEN